MRSLMIGAVTLLAFMCAANAQPGVRKPIVSVNDIQDMAGTGRAPALREMIETTVVNTGKFRIMERGAQGTGVLVGEQQRAKAGLVTSNTPGKIGGFEGVDFMVYGTITTAEAGRTRDSESSAGMLLGGIFANGVLGHGAGNGLIANSNCSKGAMALAVDIRITDGKTGELRYAKHVTQTAEGQTVCGSSGGSPVDVSGLLRAAAENVSMGLVTTMYPVKVIDLDEDGKILLNYGEGLLIPGEVFAIYAQGKQMIDPDTGAVLGNSERLLGLVRVTEVMPKMSKADLATSFALPPPRGSVAREATPQQLQMLDKKR